MKTLSAIYKVMRIAILAQEEPVYFGPFLRRVIQAKRQEIVLVAIAGNRGAGSHPKTGKERLQDIYLHWLLFEPYGFLRNLFIAWRQKSLAGTIYDKRGIAALAKEYGIPVVYLDDPNASSILNTFRHYGPDLVINQSELLLKPKFLDIPKIGVINRHASLLPKFRGRLGSFWSHYQEPPEYGTTIHFVSRELDAGPIILQEKIDLDPRWSYTRVLDALFVQASDLLLKALNILSGPGFMPLPSDYRNSRPYLFPSLEQVRDYRRILRRRRE